MKCPCDWCSSHPRFAIDHLAPKPKKGEHRNRFHRANAVAARLARRLAAIGITVKKTELQDLTSRVLFRIGYDLLANRMLVTSLGTRPYNHGADQVYERDREVGEFYKRYQKLMADVARSAFGGRFTREMALACLGRDRYGFSQYGPGETTPFPGDEYPQDRAARRAALDLAAALERYLQRGGLQAPMHIYHQAETARIAYRSAFQKALCLNPPDVLRSPSSLINDPPEELLEVMRALRGPARYEVRYPPREPKKKTVLVFYAAETPTYRYPRAA